ncbi:MAG: hypothetical protein U0353_34015 [Sandaracinus sp.]
MWGRLALTALFALSLVAVGCHRDRTRVDDRRLANLERRAARDLGCPAVAVRVERMDERLFRVSGCGAWMDYAIFARGRHRYGGAGWRRVIPLAERASAELGCAPDQIRFEGRTPRRYAIAGCGHATEMELRCNEIDCGWVATSAPGAVGEPVVVTPALTAPAPTTPAPGYGASVTVTIEGTQ